MERTVLTKEYYSSRPNSAAAAKRGDRREAARAKSVPLP